MKDSIFISYQITDTSDVIGRIYNYLVQHFGKNCFFKDVQCMTKSVLEVINLLKQRPDGTDESEKILKEKFNYPIS